MLEILDLTAQEFCSDSAPVWKLIGNIIGIVRIAIPIIIVLLGTVDLGKAVVAGEEKEISTARSILIKRVIYGLVIFFLVTLVQMIFRLVGGADVASAGCFDAMQAGISFK